MLIGQIWRGTSARQEALEITWRLDCGKENWASALGLEAFSRVCKQSEVERNESQDINKYVVYSESTTVVNGKRLFHAGTSKINIDQQRVICT